jgi:hypothetical protein
VNDAEIREHFERWAQPLRIVAPPPVDEIHRRARRRTTRLTIAAGSATAAALATVAVVGLVTAAPPVPILPVSGHHGAPGPTPAGSPQRAIGISALHLPRPQISQPVTGSTWGTGRYPAPPAAPFLMTLSMATQTALVVSASRGAVQATLHPRVAGDQFTWAAAAPNDQLFMLAEEHGFGVTFDQVQISPSGQVSGPHRVLPAVSLNVQIYAMAISADGARLALSVLPHSATGLDSVLVYNLRTGALTGDWSSASGSAVGLSWGTAGDLAVGWQDDTGSAPSGVRILDTGTGRGAHPQSLTADSVLVAPVRGFVSGMITTDGATVLAVSTGGSQVRLEEIAADSGRVLASVPIGTTGDQANSPDFCGLLWASKTGSRLITQCGSHQQLVVNGSPTTTRLALTIPDSVVGWANTFAW